MRGTTCVFFASLSILFFAGADRTWAQQAQRPQQCGGKPFNFELKDVKDKLYKGLRSVTKKPIVIAYYSGYKTKDVHEDVRQAVKKDPVVGDKTPNRNLWEGFAIVDYSEGWFVPAWAINRELRKKMDAYPGAIFLADRDQCLAERGSSDKCPGLTRRPYFKSNKGIAALVYKGHMLKKIEGAYSPQVFVRLLRRLVELAAKDASYCEARNALGI